MLAQLTNYLLQYKSVSIPHIGSFVLQYQPAQLNFADRLILPPSYAVLFNETIHVPDHQLRFITTDAVDNAVVQQQLDQFGKRLKNRIEKDTFNWNGIGFLHWKEDKVVFEAETIIMGLQPVAAHKVIREHASHTVLVGDQEVNSNDQLARQQQQSEEESTEQKRDVFVLIGWIVIALAILFIIYHFYVSELRTESSGLQSKPVMDSAPRSYR